VPKQLVIAVFLAFGMLAPPLSNAATLAAASQASQAVNSIAVQVIEYYNAALDHYFITAYPSEIAKLDSGTSGWVRTGGHFGAFSSTSPGPSLSNVCRFYGRPDAGLDSHFYSGSAEECAAVFTKFGSSWILESDDVFRIQMADPVTGSCPSGVIPVFRIFNNRKDANHRYTVDPAVRNAMIASGGTAEGFGADGVAFCADAASSIDAVASPVSVNIVVTQVASDMFSFNSTVAAALGLITYSWNFGDGSFDKQAAVSHQFQQAGTYDVVLTVTDAKGNKGSATKSVAPTVPSSPSSTPTPTATPAGGSADFDRRKNSVGVVRWFDFDAQAQLGPRSVPGAGFSWDAGSSANPVIDSAQMASGSGSLRFDIPSRSGASAGGTWWANFSDDYSVQFGENSEFFIQWRQRFNQPFVKTFFTEGGSGGQAQGGIKQLIVTTGDTQARKWNSCEAIGNVVQTYYQHRLPWAYNSCTGSASHNAYAPFEEVVNGGQDFKLQNGTTPYCLYSKQAGFGQTEVWPGCFGWVADEWMTFQIGVTLGPRDNTTNEFKNSRFRLWAARDGQPSQLLIDWKPGVPGYFPLTAGPASENQRFGKVFLLPYMTNKDGSQVHDLAQTWYDELIISTQRIPDPQSTTGQPTSVQPTSVHATSFKAGVFPEWRRAKPAGQWFEIPQTANMQGAVGAVSATIDVWNGLAFGNGKVYSVASGGHGVPQNGAFVLDLTRDQPAWTTLDQGSAPADYVGTGPYYKDGRPVSRHTYNTAQLISGANDQEGIDRVMLFTCNAAYGLERSLGGYWGGPQIDGFRLADNKYDTGGTFGNMPHFQRFGTVAKDPRTDDVYYSADYTVQKWSPKTRQINAFVPRTTLSGDQFIPSLVDAQRNRLVWIHHGGPYHEADWGPTLRFFDLATGSETSINVRGLPSYDHTNFEPFFHDTDNDRYVFVIAGDFYAIDPGSGKAAIFSRSRAVPANGGGEDRAAFMPEYGGIVWIPRYSSNALFLPTR